MIFDLFHAVLQELVAPHVSVPLLMSSDTGGRAVPYLLVECESSQEIIPRNHTWELTLSTTLVGNAFDWSRGDFDTKFEEAIAAMEEGLTTEKVRRLELPLHLYSCRLQAIDPVSTNDDDMERRAVWRLVIQL